ncbi:subtilisin-like serine protease [Gryganskiella cystojenkinii]|nr:subtilisin-like serine protease [Gryganskiella cystojenkinii]
MKSNLILLVSLAVASLALAVDLKNDQTVLSGPDAADEHMTVTEVDKKKEEETATVEDPSLAYVFDPSKKSTRGYDIDGRQEIVNIGPGLKITADGQTQSRSGPRGRQRGAVLPHKYIVRLKNGADVAAFDLESRVAAHNRLIQTGAHDGHQRTEDEEVISNQVDHEYDFGAWKGYAGQFTPELLKELEEHDQVEYVEEDTMMWAWGINEVREQDRDQEEGEKVIGVEIDEEQQFGGTMEDEDEAPTFETEAIVNGKSVQLQYYSLKAPSWGLTRISQRSPSQNNDYSYMSTAGSGVDVYIIDSGVYEGHSDFGGRATNLASFVPNEQDTDMCGHGTHVAGIVAGRRYGVAKEAQVLAIKVLDAEGQGSTSQVMAGINYMIRHATSNPNPRKVINMSLGGQYSRPVNDAVKIAVNRHGLPFFVAAGNSADDACQYSPAGVDEVFTVGGSDRSDRVGWYSCTGTCVDIFAPGSGIASDWIHSTDGAHILDGTSMAAPHVAGVAALFLASGEYYGGPSDLYADLIRHSTQGIINGLKSYDKKTTRNLLYNKLEDLNDSYTVQPQDLPDDDDEGEERATAVLKKKKSQHHHHRK